MRKNAGWFKTQIGSGRGNVVVFVPPAKVFVNAGIATQLVVVRSQLHIGVTPQVLVPVDWITTLLLTTM